MRRIAIALFLSLIVPLWPPARARGGEAAPATSAADIFSQFAGTRLPKAGDWLEYRVAYPVDPLENSLDERVVSGQAGQVAGGGTGESEGLLFIHPTFEPPVLWRTLPLRLEITGVEPTGCRVRMTFGGVGRNLFLPLIKRDDSAAFRYDEPQPEDERAVHTVGDTEFAVTVVRRHGHGVGFVRMSSPDLPFGFARFASENIDLALIGMGTGEPPVFPLPVPPRLSPEMGKLFVQEEL